MYLHTVTDLDHDLDPLGDYETDTAICFSCGQPVDRDGIATGLNAQPCFYCSGED